MRLAGRLALRAVLPLLLFASPTPAQDEAEVDEAELKGAKAMQVDTRLRAAVDAAGQSVTLQSRTLRYEVGEQRDVYSLAHRFDGEEALDPALLQRLLGENNTFTLGFWALQDRHLYAIARIPARASPLQVREAVRFVAEVADDLERELSGDADAH